MYGFATAGGGVIRLLTVTECARWSVLWLLGSVRGLATDSAALWEFEKLLRASLITLTAQQVTAAVTAHEASELYEEIEAMRQQLPKSPSQISSPQTVQP